MHARIARTGRRSIDLSAAAYLELGLSALQAGDKARAAGAFASIDDVSWAAICARFPNLEDLVATWEATR